MRNRFYSNAVAVLILIPASVMAEAGETIGKLYPVDEAARDGTLVEFRQELAQTVAARDADQLRLALSPRVVIDHGGRAGIEEFERHWRPSDGASAVWPVLEGILSLGGGFVRSELGVKFCAPYTFTSFPDGYDIYSYGAIIAKDVPLTREDDANAETVVLLDHDIVMVNDGNAIVADDDQASAWLKVTTLHGDVGYVPRSVLRSPVDYHACFTKAENEWKITSFVAGR